MSQSDLEGISFGENPENVDYGAITIKISFIEKSIPKITKTLKKNKEKRRTKTFI